MKATAKRRRSKKQIRADNEREEWEKAETARKIQRLDIVERENRILQGKIAEAKEVKEQVQDYMNKDLRKVSSESEETKKTNPLKRKKKKVNRLSVPIPKELF